MRKPILFLSIVCVFFSCTDQKNIVENEVDMSLTKYVNPFVGTSGFYPICPSSNIYSIGSPRLEAVEMTLYNCKKVRVTTENYSKENVYIQSMTLNGKPYNKTYLTYDDIKMEQILSLF